MLFRWDFCTLCFFSLLYKHIDNLLMLPRSLKKLTALALIVGLALASFMEIDQFFHGFNSLVSLGCLVTMLDCNICTPFWLKNTLKRYLITLGSSFLFECCEHEQRLCTHCKAWVHLMFESEEEICWLPLGLDYLGYEMRDN